MRLFLILIFHTCFSISLLSQNKSIYIFKNRYSSDIIKKTEKSNVDFKEIKILLGYMIDPKKQDIIDYKSVNKWITELFPLYKQEGTLCIDLENKLYQNIRGNNITRVKSSSKKEYLDGEKAFIDLVKYVKKLRPNVKVGIFEMPFRVYSTSEIRKNTSQNLDSILQQVDIIFPCVYVPFPAKIKSTQSNYYFLKTNLDLAFKYGDKLNKPVIPFFWYLYYSSDKTYRYELMPKEELWKYVQYIEEYKSVNNSGVKGIVWWDTPTPYSKKLIKSNFAHKLNIKSHTIDNSFSYYFGF